MAEYISRDEAIERIQPHIKPQTVYGEGYLQAIEHATAILELMPAADVQPVNQWISVKDRLPEEIGYYLVVIGNEMLISIDIAEYCEGYWHKHDEVIYWQPLPELPKEGDTNG